MSEDERIEALRELCLMATEQLGARKHGEAAKLLDLALEQMKDHDVPEQYRASAQRFRGLIHMIAREYPAALASLRTLRSRVPAGTDETRSAMLGMIEDIAKYPGSASGESLADVLDEGIGCLELCTTDDERAKLEAALLQLTNKLISAVSADARTHDHRRLVRLRGFADRLDSHARSMTKAGRHLSAVILAFATTISATLETENVVADTRRLTRWCDDHGLWDDSDVRYHVAYALETAVDRLKTDAGNRKTRGDGLQAAERYAEATRTYELLEQHYGSSVADDKRIANKLADAAHALLGADALLARKAEAMSRMMRLREIHELHLDVDAITKVWLDAPLRYVVALAMTHAIDELRAEALRARDAAKRHLSAADYDTWRAKMCKSLQPSFLDKIGF